MRKLIYCGLYLVLLFLCIFSIYIHQQTIRSQEHINHKEDKLDTDVRPLKGKKAESEVNIYKASLSAIGDVLIHDRVYEPAQIMEGKYDFIPYLKQVQAELRKADITVANQESMIGGTEIGLSTYPAFNSPYEVGIALKESGVDIVTIANNHTLDRGEKAIKRAISHWNEIGIPYTGSFLSKEDQRNIRTIEKNHITFSFLAYTYGTNGIETPKDKPFLVNRIDIENIRKDILKAKEESDVVVVSLHFGNEYQRLPNDEQKQLAQQTANAGADIIIGHHPHVLQPMEWIEREDGRRSFVAYSLGNFFTGQTEDYKDIGGIMKIDVEKRVKDGESSIVLKEPSFIPTFVNEEYVVSLLEELPAKKDVYEEIKKHMNRWLPELKFS